MKDAILALSALLAYAPFASGQGQLLFNNTVATLVSTNATHGGPATGPTEAYAGGGAPQFIYALFAAPSTVTTVSGVMDANWTFTGAYATNSSIATGGRLIGGAPFLPAPYASGTTFSFLVRGWSSTIAGQDWPTTQAFMNNIESDPIAFGSQGQLFGTSGIASLVVGGTPGPVPPIFGTIPGVSIQGFVLDQVPIPEPSVFALAGFGITGVLVSHRRFRVREAEHGLSRNDP